MAGMVHAVFVRSIEAHALIDSITLEENGCEGRMYTASDLGLDRPMPNQYPSPLIAQSIQASPLAVDEVCYVGEPVAVVVAETMAAAVDCADTVHVDYTSLPVVIDHRHALDTDSAPAHQSSGSNLVGHPLRRLRRCGHCLRFRGTRGVDRGGPASRCSGLHGGAGCARRVGRSGSASHCVVLDSGASCGPGTPGLLPGTLARRGSGRRTRCRRRLRSQSSRLCRGVCDRGPRSRSEAAREVGRAKERALRRHQSATRAERNGGGGSRWGRAHPGCAGSADP